MGRYPWPLCTTRPCASTCAVCALWFGCVVLWSWCCPGPVWTHDHPPTPQNHTNRCSSAATCFDKPASKSSSPSTTTPPTPPRPPPTHHHRQYQFQYQDPPPPPHHRWPRAAAAATTAGSCSRRPTTAGAGAGATPVGVAAGRGWGSFGAFCWPSGRRRYVGGGWGLCSLVVYGFVWATWRADARGGRGKEFVVKSMADASSM